MILFLDYKMEQIINQLQTEQIRCNQLNVYISKYLNQPNNELKKKILTIINGHEPTKIIELIDNDQEYYFYEQEINLDKINLYQLNYQLASLELVGFFQNGIISLI